MVPSAQSRKSCPTDARPNTSRSWRRWVPYSPTAGPGRCCRSFCRLVSRRLWKRPGSEHFVWVPGWSGKPSRAQAPSRRWQRNLLHSPLTAATCGRLVSTRGCSATALMAGRIASPRNVPERAGHCLTRMLPSRGRFVNQLSIGTSACRRGSFIHRRAIWAMAASTNSMRCDGP